MKFIWETSVFSKYFAKNTYKYVVYIRAVMPNSINNEYLIIPPELVDDQTC